MATMLETLKADLARAAARRGPDSVSVRGLKDQIASVESAEATRLRAGEIESAKSERYVAQVVTKSDTATLVFPKLEETFQEHPHKTSPEPVTHEGQSSPPSVCSASRMSGPGGDEA